jgi:ABC-type Fe3+-hydroxamate transport system substrate-binding protein
VDDGGDVHWQQQPPERIISLVPSWTETLCALGVGERLVGATTYCVEPREALKDVSRVGGPKNPRLSELCRLRPDLVVVNVEENRVTDALALRQAGIPLHVTDPRSVDDAMASIRRLGEAVGCDAEAERLAGEIEERVKALRRRNFSRQRAFCPVWSSPWVTCSAHTYTSSVLELFGLENIYQEPLSRYPHVELEAVRERQPELVILPDEPYEFTAVDARRLENFFGVPALIVDGRNLHWYGSHMKTAFEALELALLPVQNLPRVLPSGAGERTAV